MVRYFLYFLQTFKSKTLAEWVQILVEHDIEFWPVNTTVDQLWQDHHIQARQMLLEITDPATGENQYEVGFHMKFTATPVQFWRGLTPMAADTEVLLAELGYTSAGQARFGGTGAIA